MKRGDDYKKESDRYWAKRDDANKQSNTFKTELNSLNSDYQQLTNEVKLFGEQSRKKKKKKRKRKKVALRCRSKVAQAGKILVAHTERNPDFDLVPAVYMCVQQVVAGLEDYAKHHLAPCSCPVRGQQ